MLKGLWPTKDPMLQLNRTKAGILSSASERLNKKTTCTGCKMLKHRTVPYKGVVGKGKKGILIVTPNQTDGLHDLRDILGQIGLDLERDCWLTHAVQCPTTSEIKDKHVNCCRQRILQDIKKQEPSKIILLGKIAVQSILGQKDIAIFNIDKWAGLKIPDPLYNAWIFPTYSLRQLDEKLLKEPDNVILKLFGDHIEAAVKWKKPLSEHLLGDISKKIKTTTDVRKACEYLKKLNDLEPKLLAFDIESTGLKPDRKGHKIRTISFCYSSDESMAFPLYAFMKNKVFMLRLKKVLRNKNIGKIAHNMKMEDRWVRKILGDNYQVRNWNHDTMLGAHIVDNRRRFTKLKFQSYIYFGLYGYEKDMKPYMEEPLNENELKYGNNRFNRIMEPPLKPLLFYNAIDSLVTFELAKIQKPIIKKRKLNYKLFHEALLMFSDMEHVGICVDHPYFEKQDRRLQKRLDKYHAAILESKECKAWKKSKGKDLEYTGDDLTKILYSKQYLGLKPTKKTDKGNISIDNEVLKKLTNKVSFINDLILWKKYDKLKNTFIKQILQETIDGVIRPNNNLNLVISYRTSTDHINWQNQPHRDPESSEIIRKGFIPNPGCTMLGVDYSGVEVNVSLAHHLDSNMRKYLTDKSTDMHRDTSMDIYFCDINQITKSLRSIGKNGFVFPQFYGDWYQSCAKILWGACEDEKLKDGTPVRAHLKANGIKNYHSFEEHIKEVERIFWDERFPEYKAWKDKTYKEYKRKGYVRSHTGFECGGLMSKNEVLNLSIQGDACHCLLWAMVKLNKIFKKKKLKSKSNGQIHDEACFSINLEEIKEVLPIIKKVMTEDIMKAYDWLQVPLEVDMEMSEISGNWFDREEIYE